MKSLIILISILVGQTVFAADTPSEKFMSAEAQMKYIEKEAKEIRRDYYINGHEDVSSSESFVTKSILDDHYKFNKRYEEPLDSDEWKELYRCYHRKTCELYLIRVTSNYWGGYGAVAHFVLLNTKTKKQRAINHVIYAE